MAKPKFGKYRHFKSKKKEYEVIGIAHHSETLEELAIYRALYDSAKFGKNALWARPIDLFLGQAEVNGKKIPRFKYLGDN